MEVNKVMRVTDKYVTIELVKKLGNMEAGTKLKVAPEMAKKHIDAGNAKKYVVETKA